MSKFLSKAAGGQVWRLKATGLLAAGLTAACGMLVGLAIFELCLRLSGFSFQLYPELIEFGYPKAEILNREFRADPDLFWVPKDYGAALTSLQSKKPDLIFMGDSCTQVGGYPALFAGLVSEARPGRSWSFANLAVAGWSSYQGLIQMQRDVLPLQPRYVSIYFGWNDHWYGFGIEDKLIKTLHASTLYRFQRFKTVQLMMKMWLWYLQGQSSLYRPQRVALADFRDNLSEMVRLARSERIIPILLTAPSSHTRGREPKYLAERWVDKLDQLVPLHQSYVQVVREVASKESVVICDLAAEFQERGLTTSAYFQSDGIHLTPLGNEQIAKFLIECLEPGFGDSLDPPILNSK